MTHRLALDNPDTVQKVMILDVVPAPDLYQRTDAFFAKAYFHWFLFLQPYPLPEQFRELMRLRKRERESTQESRE